MVTTVATRANTAEGQVGVGKLEDSVVGDEGAAGSLFLKAGSVGAAGAAEIVNSERLVATIDEIHDLVEFLVGNDGEDGAENLILHELRVAGRVEDHSRNETIISVVAADHNGALVALEIAGHSLCVVLVDNLAKVGDIFTIHCLGGDLLLQES